MTFDYYFKRILKDAFPSDIIIDNDIKVGTLPLIIDLIIKIPPPFLKNEVQNYSNTLPVLIRNFREINIIEYKSSHDIPNKGDLLKLFGYFGLYAEQNNFELADLINQKCTLWYICCLKPKFLKKLTNKSKIVLEKGKGLYKISKSILGFNYFILIIDELELKEENYPLLLNLKGKKLVEVIKKIIREGLIKN
ncbi:MAG: hypothetical protein GF364_06675 [Candidatus Lokiarchaeota archaeon]|nr:hypothetical protein [Candidatus Lokiarchaeota archaeon]